MTGFVSCPNCNSPVAYQKEDIGETITCGGCQQLIQLDGPANDDCDFAEPEFPRGGISLIRVITAPEFRQPGMRVVETLDVVTERRVYGSNVFKDIAIGIRDYVGGRSRTAEDILATAEREILDSLRAKAAGAGANALIDMRMQFGELGSRGTHMFFATGQATPVILETHIESAEDSPTLAPG